MCCWMLLMRACLVPALLGISLAANATFHLWKISEVYSNADGTVQFVEFSTAFGGQQFIAGQSLTAFQGATTRQFTFSANLPANTTNRRFLVATQGFAALGIVTPDYIVADNFLFLPSGGVDFAGVDSVTYASLPADGSLSIDRTGATAVNSPTNFAGSSGTLVPATPPGAPSIGPGTPGNGQATISFTPPTSNGGSPITGYTATCNPGSVAASGPASPLVVGGLTNGTAYACAVTATNAKGTGPSSASVAVTPVAFVRTFTGASPTGSGTVSAAFTGGGPGCSLASARLIALVGDAASPPAASVPANVLFPHGLFAFVGGGCGTGSTIVMTVTYPNALPAGTQYWKYGPTAAQPAAHWYALAAVIAGNTASFSITDGGLGDDDLAANGSIVDQGGPGFPVPGAGSAIPTLGEWALFLLAGLLGVAGLRRHRSNLR